MNHPLVGNYLTKEDEMLMDYLQTFDVTFVGDDGSFRMEMVRLGFGFNLSTSYCVYEGVYGLLY